MLYISRWKMLAIIVITLIVCSFAIPNFFPKDVVESWPKWAQRHIVLGLDLQGGSHILLEVDAGAVRKEKVEALRDDVRRVVRENRLGSPASVTVRGNTVEFRVRDGADQKVAAQKFQELSQPLGGLLQATGQRSIDVVDAGGGLFRLTVTEPAMLERIRQSVDQSIQIIERRVNELGTVEPSIARQGVDRVLVQVPGPAGSAAPEGPARQDRQALVPDGRHDHHAGSGRDRQASARFRIVARQPEREQAALCH
jgi:preprotein translocase subunit SecD